MNGEIKYQGANNDAILILNNVLSHPGNTGFFGSGAVPGYTAVEQLP
jgi:hypothetical protein